MRNVRARFWFPLLLSAGLAGCSTLSRRSLPDYDAELRYWRDLPYPRIEKLIDERGRYPTQTWICQDYNHHTQVASADFNEAKYPLVIDYHRDVFNQPAIIHIYKRRATSEGKVLRTAAISDTGKLESEEQYLNGKRHGIWYRWYANGKLREARRYADDRVDGTALTYSPSGKVLQKEIYRDARIVEAWNVGVDGRWRKCVEAGTGKILAYGEDGAPSGAWSFRNGQYYAGAR